MLDDVSTTGEKPRREVARLEEVLTPAPAETDAALIAYQQADAAGDAQGSTNLGVLLEQKGDLEGALAAYRRAEERGDVNGSFNLGCLLAEVGDLAGAEAALRRADEHGDAAGASNLGVLLERRGDLEGALAAYRRADERGDANGAFNLGLLLAASGSSIDARAAYERASQGDDPEVAARARCALEELEKQTITKVEATTDQEEGELGDVPVPESHEPASAEEASTRVAPGQDERTGTEESTVDGPESVIRPSGRRSSWNWVAAVCLLALIAMVAVLVGRRLRRFS